MIIDNKNYFLLERPELDHFIDGGLFDMWKDFEKFTHIEREAAIRIACIYDESFPKYIFTSTALDVIRKISVNQKTIDIIGTQELYGQFSTKDTVFKFAAISGLIIAIMLKKVGDDLQTAIFTFKKDGQWIPIDNIQMMFLQMIIFLKYSDAETKYLESGKGYGSKKNGNVNRSKTNIHIVNSTWNTTLIRTEGFPVNGHIRLQPHGIGMKERKLIWIDPFEKQGYIKKANNQ